MQQSSELTKNGAHVVRIFLNFCLCVCLHLLLLFFFLSSPFFFFFFIIIIVTIPFILLFFSHTVQPAITEGEVCFFFSEKKGHKVVESQEENERGKEDDQYHCMKIL